MRKVDRGKGRKGDKKGPIATLFRVTTTGETFARYLLAKSGAETRLSRSEPCKLVA